MLNFATVSNHGEQTIRGVVSSKQNAAVLVFPYNAGGVTTAASGDDVIDQRMKAPLSYNEEASLCNMIKYRAQQLQQEIWIVTGTFLTAMGVEEMNDLSRRDFVRAVSFLVGLEQALDVSALAQSVM